MDGGEGVCLFFFSPPRPLKEGLLGNSTIPSWVFIKYFLLPLPIQPSISLFVLPK